MDFLAAIGAIISRMYVSARANVYTIFQVSLVTEFRPGEFAMIFVMRFIPHDRLWQVGYFRPGGEWVGVYECARQEEAAQRINYLHGGTGRPIPHNDDGTRPGGSDEK
jgi:hypothetical protein